MDFLLDTSTHDIVWVNGPLRKEETTQPFTQTVAQRLKIRLTTFRGEWFTNTEYGPAWWQRILGHKATKETVDLLLQQEILKENGVKEIVSFTSTFQNRVYSMIFRVRVVTGEITAPINIQNFN